MAGGLEYEFVISVSGTGELRDAAGAADELKHALDGARDAEAELGAASAGAAGGLAEQAAAMDAAAASVRDLDRGALAQLNKRISEGARAARDFGDGFSTSRREIDRSGEAMRNLDEEARRMGLTASEASIGAAGAMDSFRSRLEEAHRAAADAERGIDGLQNATSKSEISSISAAHGLKGLEKAGKDAARGVKDLEKEADQGGGFLKGMFSKLLKSGTEGLSSVQGAVFSPMTGLIAAAVGAAAGAVPAVLSLGAGFASFGALAAPALYKVKQGLSDVTYAQQQYQLARGVEKRDPSKSNLENEQKALAALKTTWAQLPSPVRGAVSEIRQFGRAWAQASRRSGIQRDALGDIKLAARDARDLIPTVTSLAKATAPVIHGMLGGLGKEFRSKGFTDFIRTLGKEIGPAAHALKGIGSAFGGFITQLTSREAKPGTQMLQNIGKFLKTITPGAVSGLVGLTKGISGLFAGLNKIAGSKAVSNIVSDIQGMFGHLDQTYHDFTSGKHLSLGDMIHDFFGIGSHSRAVPVKIPVAPQITAGKAHQQDLLASLGFKGGHPKAVTLPIKTHISSGDLGKALDSAQQLKAHAATVKVKVKADPGDVKRQIADAAKTGGNIPVKGRVTLTGLAAGIKSQIASLHIPDTKVHIAIQVTGVGSAKAAMASVVGAARQDAAAATAALNRLGAAGAAAGRALDQGLAGGILAGESSVVSAAAQVASAAGAAARTAAGIASPSKVWHGIGKNMIEGLILGLEGGKAQVQAAARAITGAAAPFKDAAITATVKKLREDVRKAFRAGDIGKNQRDGLIDYIDRSNRKLMHLAQERAKIMGQIKAATALAHSVTQAAIASADITGFASNVAAAKNAGKPSGTIQDQQKEQLGKIRQFTHAIKQLKREGLDKTSIKQLLAAGVSGGLPAAQQLLSEGPKAVKESAKLQQEIIKASRGLGVTGANAAYESASQIGKGLAAGLRASLKPVVAAMRELARALVAQLRKELGLKPGQGLGGLLDGLGGGGGHGHGGGHHHRRHHGPIPPPIEMFPGGPSHGTPVRMHPGALGSGARTTTVVHNHITVTLDGQKVGTVVQTQTLRHARRNISSGIKLPGRAA